MIDWTDAELSAMQRYIRGERLGPGAKKSLKKAESKAREHRSYIRSGNADEDIEMHAWFLYDEFIKAGGDPSKVVPPTGSRLGARSDRGRSTPRVAAGSGLAPAAVVSRPPRPPAVAGAPGGGGGGAFDGRTASPEQYARKLALLGVSLAPGTLDEFANKRRGSTVNEISLTTEEAIARNRDHRVRAANAAKAEEIDEARKAGKLPFDAMDGDTSLDELRVHLAELGVRDPQLDESFIPRRTRPLAPAFDAEGRKIGAPKSKEQEVRERRDRRLYALALQGKTDVTGLSEEAFQSLLKARGLETSSTWPAQRGPSRR